MSFQIYLVCELIGLSTVTQKQKGTDHSKLTQLWNGFC